MGSLSYYRQIAAEHPALPGEQERELMDVIGGGASEDEKVEAIDTLVKHNVWLAIAIALDRVGRHPALVDDAVDVAVNCLFSAARRVKNRGARFADFVRPRINGEMVELLRQARPVHPSRYTLERVAGKHQERQPRVDYNAATLGVACPVVSLDEPSPHDQGYSPAAILMDIIPCQDTSPSIAAETAIDVAAAMKRLSPRARQIVAERFGLDGVPARTEELALKYGVSKRRIRQMLDESMTVMRKVLVD